MRVEKAFHKGTHHYSFRSGEQAEILGVKMVTPDNKLPARPCLHVRYEDGTEDYTPISEHQNYQIEKKI